MSRHVPTDFPEWYQEGFSNCVSYKLVDLLTNEVGIAMLKRMHRMVREITGPQPTLLEYRTELQRTIDEDLRRGILQREIPSFDERFAKMKNEKGTEMTILHLTCGIMRLLSNIGEAYPKKDARKEEEERILF